MKNKAIIWVLCFLVLMPTAIFAQSSPKRIIINADRNPQDLEAAQELQSFLRKGGLNLYIVSRLDKEPQEGSIYVGQNPYSDTDTNIIPDNGYLMSGNGSHFILCGKGTKGTLYAVYDFLERYCNYRLYTPAALCINDLKHFTIPSDTVIERPAFSYREVCYYYPNHSQLYADWHHIHTEADRNREWGMFVHTFGKLVPPSQYFNQHSEWFSMRDGQRVRDGQLCLSNPYVLDTLCHNLAKRMAEKPESDIWSVSSNDNYNVCQCPECKRLDSIYGGYSGTMLYFVNQVARRFPDKTIATLAYQYTRNAPIGNAIKPEKNVLIVLCPIEADRAKPIATNPSESSFRKDIGEWSRLVSSSETNDNRNKAQLFVWDYIVQFRNFWNPFPNLHVLKPNLQFFRDNGVTMMFEQGTGANNVTSWMDLRNYLVAKLMWNPDLDIDSLCSDFSRGYYGNAAHYVSDIIQNMTHELSASGKRLDIYGFPIDAADGYLSPRMLQHYDSLMTLAFNAVTDSSQIKRLRYFKLALDFANIELRAAGKIATTNEELKAMTGDMVEQMERFGVSQMMEMGISPREYYKTICHFADKSLTQRPHYKVALRNDPTEPYTCNGAQSLTDGKGGIMDYRHSWLGFFGQTLDATISLGNKPIDVSEINMDFYFYALSWIFLPESIEYFISNDNRHWTSVGLHKPTHREVLATPSIETFTTTLAKPRKARYVRIVAKPLPSIPSWHRATGQKAWIFTDEVIIK